MKNKKSEKAVNMKKLSRQILLIISDIILFSLSSFLALLLRFEFSINELTQYEFLDHVLMILPLTAVLTVVIFALLGLYSSLWEFAGEAEIFRIILSCSFSVVLQTALQFMSGLTVPRSFVFIHFLLFLIFTFVLRFSYRFLRHRKDTRKKSSGAARRTMIVAAGDAGATILRELQRSSFSKSRVVCLIDDDDSKIGKYMFDVPVAGKTEDIPEVCLKYDIEDIVFAIPAASAKRKKEILSICQKTGCTLKTLPGIYQLVNGEVNVQKIRKVQIEDLLARESIKVNLDEIVGYVNDSVVLVTGGGGSIGSELCRQIAGHGPRKLIIFDIYENNAYAIQQELNRKNPDLDLVVLIGSVRDKKRVDSIFETYKPDIVFHAAAHKHVPLMENSPNESIKNNVFGTYNVASAADRYKAESFILISTDKAVNPTNIMGASKRICEMIICNFANHSHTKYACVRFGNVLGSNGSVIPLFKEQIKNGGPVTVTHKDIIRYFMTIPEAVSLVLQAGAYAKDGEIFVLDMGEPVRIDDLARNMIKLSGFEPDVDIPIEYTGLRPGEKLFEELLLSEEGLEKTPNDLIFIGHLESIDKEIFEEKLSWLEAACESNSEDIRKFVMDIVPTYNPRKA